MHQHASLPGVLPDLSPYLNICGTSSVRAVRQRHPQPRTRGHWEAGLQAEGGNIPQVRIQRLIRSMSMRCGACVTAVGGHIYYVLIREFCCASHCCYT